MNGGEFFRVLRSPGYFVSRADVQKAIRNASSSEQEMQDIALTALDFVESNSGLVELREVVDCFIEVEQTIEPSKKQIFGSLMERVLISKDISIIATPNDSMN